MKQKLFKMNVTIEISSSIVFINSEHKFEKLFLKIAKNMFLYVVENIKDVKCVTIEQW